MVKKIKLFGIEIEEVTARVIYIIAIIALLGHLFWLLYELWSMANYATTMSYFSSLGYGDFASYGLSSFTPIFIWILGTVAICLYVIIKIKKQLK